MPADVQNKLGLLNGNNQAYLATQEALIGTDYIWGGNNPDTDGGVDCSGAVLHGINQLGNNVPDQTANDIYKNFTKPVVGSAQPGDLRFLDYNNDSKMDHVQTISTTSGTRINPSGGPSNDASNPGIIESLPAPLPAAGEIRRISFK